ncbi:MAG TPA: hypothetical protein VH500_09190 [Nitrososphaeraceae archaeon]|jgi:hypothetical protein
MNVYVVYVGENPKTSGYEYAVFDSKEKAREYCKMEKMEEFMITECEVQ